MGVRGGGNIIRNLRVLGVALKKDCTLEVLKAVTQTELKAKQRVPVDNSPLKTSIYHDMDYPKILGEVGAKEFYAPFVEFGTGTNVEVPNGYEDFAMKFYVNGKGTLMPRPFLIPAFLEEKQKFVQNIKNLVTKYSGR